MSNDIGSQMSADDTADFHKRLREWQLSGNGKLAEVKTLIEERLAVTVATDAVASGNFPFGMDGDEGRIYLSGKADALQWVLEMLP